MKGFDVEMCLLIDSARFGHRKLAEFGQNVKKLRFFKTRAFTGLNFWTQGRRNSVLCSNERSWCIDMMYRYAFWHLWSNWTLCSWPNSALLTIRTFYRQNKLVGQDKHVIVIIYRQIIYHNSPTSNNPYKLVIDKCHFHMFFHESRLFL